MVEAKHVGPAEQNDGAWKTKPHTTETDDSNQSDRTKSISQVKVCRLRTEIQVSWSVHSEHVLKHHVTVATPSITFSPLKSV